MGADAEQAIQSKYEKLGALFDERLRRRWAAVEAEQLGRGGIAMVARATGLSRTTIYQGLEELREAPGKVLRRARIRSAGGDASG